MGAKQSSTPSASACVNPSSVTDDAGGVAKHMTVAGSPASNAEPSWHGENYAWWEAMSQVIPRAYACARVRPDQPPTLDGDVRGEPWAHAPWTEDFGDIQGQLGPPPRLRTRAKLLWDDTHLWFGCWMEEPQLVATLTEKNSVIFHDNDIEVFIDPDGDNHHYYEFEMNALDTIWELVLEKPYKDGGPCLSPHNLPGTESSVVLEGELNSPQAPPASGWGVVTRFALADLTRLGGDTQGSRPQPGSFWRINFSRVQWRWKVNAAGCYEKVAGLPEDNWTWSPQGIIDMHRPEQWGYLTFCKDDEEPQLHPAIPDETFKARRAVMEVYHLQRDFFASKKRYADSTTALGICTGDSDGRSGTHVGQSGGSSGQDTVSDAASLPVFIVVALDGSGYEATCCVRKAGRPGEPPGLYMHTREDSKIWSSTVPEQLPAPQCGAGAQQA